MNVRCALCGQIDGTARQAAWLEATEAGLRLIEPCPACAARAAATETLGRLLARHAEELFPPPDARLRARTAHSPRIPGGGARVPAMPGRSTSVVPARLLAAAVCLLVAILLSSPLHLAPVAGLGRWHLRGAAAQPIGATARWDASRGEFVVRLGPAWPGPRCRLRVWSATGRLLADVESDGEEIRAAVTLPSGSVRLLWHVDVLQDGMVVGSTGLRTLALRREGEP